MLLPRESLSRSLSLARARSLSRSRKRARDLSPALSLARALSRALPLARGLSDSGGRVGLEGGKRGWRGLGGKTSEGSIKKDVRGRVCRVCVCVYAIQRPSRSSLFSSSLLSLSLSLSLSLCVCVCVGVCGYVYVEQQCNNSIFIISGL